MLFYLTTFSFLFYALQINPMCGRGGIGRRARLKIWFPLEVGVRVSPPAPFIPFKMQQVIDSQALCV